MQNKSYGSKMAESKIGNTAIGRQAFGYFLVSISSLIINLIARYLLGFYIPFWCSVGLAYVLGLFTSFYLSSRFVFKQKGNFFRFSFVASIGLIGALIASTLSLYLLENLNEKIDYVDFNKEWLELLAHINGIAISFMLNFLGHKFFSFKKSD